MIVIQTFGYTMIAIRIFRYDKYSILKYRAILRKGAQHTSWGRSPLDPISFEHDLNITNNNIHSHFNREDYYIHKYSQPIPLFNLNTNSCPHDCNLEVTSGNVPTWISELFEWFFLLLLGFQQLSRLPAAFQWVSPCFALMCAALTTFLCKSQYCITSDLF